MRNVSDEMENVSVAIGKTSVAIVCNFNCREVAASNLFKYSNSVQFNFKFNLFKTFYTLQRKTRRLTERANAEAGVGATESERIFEQYAPFNVPGLSFRSAQEDVEPQSLRIRPLQIQIGRNHGLVDGLNAETSFHGTGRSLSVTQSSFHGTDERWRSFNEQTTNGVQFDSVAQWSGRGMGVDISHVASC